MHQFKCLLNTVVDPGEGTKPSMNIFQPKWWPKSMDVASIHSYNTRLASKSTYYLNTIKTNYGKFNFRFAAVKVWNNLDESIKHLPLKSFENKVMFNILQSYCSWVFNWYLYIYFFLLFLLFFSFSFFSFYLFTNSLFFLAVVPTYFLCLNII